jgi:signal transduction histidine kinase
LSQELIKTQMNGAPQNAPDLLKLQKLLQALADHLSQVHENILDAWRQRAERDATLTPSSHLTRAEFVNHIPLIIDAFCSRLHAWPEDDTPQQRQLEREAVQSHSQDRWQLGYNMRALVRDWGHLNVCLLQELDHYGRIHPDLQAIVLPEARQAWAELVNDSIAQSAVEYHALLQVEALARLRDLEAVLEGLREVEQLRGHSLHTAAHDLKGSLSVVMSVASLMEKERLSPTERVHMSKVLGNAVAVLHQMLMELMDMARLEAGQDPRSIEPFDAGIVLTELCTASQSLAAGRGLTLKAAGPATLPVEGDVVKVRRVAQNLLLNALKYTNKGGVVVAWQAQGEEQWLLRVQDSGPGLGHGGLAPDGLAQGTQAAAPSPAQMHGEGVGLSIVKRLCELLDARVELESRAGVGTTFRVFLPRHYRKGNHVNRGSRSLGTAQERTDEAL